MAEPEPIKEGDLVSVPIQARKSFYYVSGKVIAINPPYCRVRVTDADWKGPRSWNGKLSDLRRSYAGPSQP